MSRGELTTQLIERLGLQASYTAAAATGHYFTNDGTTTFLHVVNGGGGGSVTTVEFPYLSDVVTPYEHKVVNMGPIAYWPLDEGSGTNAENVMGDSDKDGTYTGVSLDSISGPDLKFAGQWDGAADYCDIYSSALNTAFDGAEGTLSIWAKVSGAGVWTDAANRFIFRLEVDADNLIGVRKNTTNNQLVYVYEANTTEESITKGSVSDINWMHIAITWSKTAEEVKAYYNGAQEGATQTALGVWAGSLAPTSTLIGSRTTGPLNVWDGYLAHAAIFDSALSATRIRQLADVGLAVTDRTVSVGAGEERMIGPFVKPMYRKRVNLNLDVITSVTVAAMKVKEKSTLPYRDKVLTIEAANLIAYWPLDELSGANADNFEGTALRDGTYTGVTLNSAISPTGHAAGLWDGTNDYCNIYSASLEAAFNKAEGTVAMWFKVSGAGVWTDGTLRYILHMREDALNRISIQKLAANNTIKFQYEANNTDKQVSAAYSATTWTHLAITWSVSGDAMKAYVNGTQAGATQNGLGVWVGGLTNSVTNIGANATTPTNVTDGYLAHTAIWTTPLTPAQIASLAQV